MSLTATQVAQARIVAQDAMSTVVSVETYAGGGAYGPIYATAVNVTCNVDTTRQLVRGVDGSEVTSERTLQVRAADEARFTPGSRVTVGGFASTVLSVSPKAYTGQVVYVEVACS